MSQMIASAQLNEPWLQRGRQRVLQPMVGRHVPIIGICIYD